MARSVSLRQVKEIGASSPDDGDVLIFSSSSGKYNPAPQGSASKSIMNDIVTVRSDAQIIVSRNTGDVVYV